MLHTAHGRIHETPAELALLAGEISDPIGDHAKALRARNRHMVLVSSGLEQFTPHPIQDFLPGMESALNNLRLIPVAEISEPVQETFDQLQILVEDEEVKLRA